MKCYDESILQRFVDGEISPLFLNRVAAHLQKCERCRSLAERLKRENDDITRAFDSDIAAPDLSVPIMDEIRSLPARLPKKSEIRFPVKGIQIAAAAVLVILFVVFLLLDRGSPSFVPDGDILVRAARVDGQAVQTHIFESGDSETKFIWLEKI